MVSKPKGVLTAYQKRTLTAHGSGPNKRTPLSYQDPYFGDGGTDVNFRVQNIIEQAKRNGSLIYKVVRALLDMFGLRHVRCAASDAGGLNGCSPMNLAAGCNKKCRFCAKSRPSTVATLIRECI
jgi:hypothetical protein